jgi:hypothetical protein
MKKHQRPHHSQPAQPREFGGAVLPFISGMGMGAGIMYALDPDRGNRRRAMAQQKLFRLGHLVGDAVDKGVRDLEHRAEGLFAEAMSLVRRERIPDDVLELRVRAKLGRVASHPGSIEVRAESGHVILSGPVLRGEAEHIAHCIRHLRGVQGVDVRLEEHDSSENMPGLQGGRERPGDKPELLQENWAPGTRLVMGTLGMALLTRAIRKPGFLNTAAGLLGLGLLARSARNTRVVNTLVDAVKPAPGPRAGRRPPRSTASEVPAEARRDVVGYSGVYPATGPFPPGPAEVRVAGSLGGGNYEDHGSSEMTYTGDTVLGALTGSEAGPRTRVDLMALLQPGEIPRERWLTFFNELDKGLNAERVTVEVREGGQTRVVQRDMPISGFGADVRPRELIIDIGVGLTKDDMVIHTISARRVLVRDGGERRLLEIEANDGRVVVVSFRSSDLAPKRVVA